MPRTKRRRLAYDPDARLTSVTGAIAGATTTYTYDAYGRIRTITDADAYAITTDYDVFDRPTRVTYPNGAYDETTYDRLDVSTRRDRAGRVTRYYYDPLRRLVSTRDPAGRVVAQEWCACGSLDALVDANGHRTRWERDLQGRVTREIRADGVTATGYTYGSAAGRLLTVTDPKAQVTTYTYALDNALLSTTFTNAQIATPSVSYTYDGQYGRLATMTDGMGLTTYTHHPTGQLGAAQFATVDGPLTNDTISYSYDELGRVTTRAINGVGVTWAFDALGRTTSEVNLLGTFAYTYDGLSTRVLTVNFPNAQTSVYSYLNNAGDRRLETIHHKYPGGATLSRFDYTYDAVGNILTWRQQADADAVLWAYGYDAADQLTWAVKKTPDALPTVLKTYMYGYDPAGNRTSEQIDDQLTGATYDVLNRLVSQQPSGAMVVEGSVSEPATVTVQAKQVAVRSDQTFSTATVVAPGTNVFTVGATDPSGNATSKQYEVDSTGTVRSLTYDANGNLTSDGTRTFEWDARNQLVAVTEGSQRAEYSYDGIGRRVRIRTLTGGTETGDSQFVWCSGAICEERTDGAVNTRFYSSAVERSGSAYYHFRDHLTSIREITNGSGILQGRLEYDPYGSATVVAGAPVARLGFGGLTLSDFSGIHLAVYRAYDSRLGRWISQDPIGINGGINVYAYVGNGSINAIDPSGLVKMWIGGGKSDCDYYKKRCDEQSACGPTDSYYCKAIQCCRDFPDTLINRCVRRCLIIMDQSGIGPATAHVVCYSSCAKFDLWNTRKSCKGVSAIY